MWETSPPTDLGTDRLVSRLEADKARQSAELTRIAQIATALIDTLEMPPQFHAHGITAQGHHQI